MTQDPKEDEDPPSLGRLGRVAIGLLLMAFGLGIATLFGLATLSEIEQNDYFGSGVATLVTMFGMLLTRSGYWKITRQAPPPQLRGKMTEVMLRGQRIQIYVPDLSEDSGRRR